jgi:hypothetical protein
MTSEKSSARSGEQRKTDVLKRLAEDEDAWVSTTGPHGEPYLMPLSFLWHEGELLMATRTTNPTAENVARTGQAVVALGHTRDVVLVETEAETFPSHALPAGAGKAFVAKLGWDARDLPHYSFLRFRPRTIRAWREEKSRYLMRDGAWLV